MTGLLIVLFVMIMMVFSSLMARIFAPGLANNGIVTDRAEMARISRRIQNSPNYRPCGRN